MKVTSDLLFTCLSLYLLLIALFHIEYLQQCDTNMYSAIFFFAFIPVKETWCILTVSIQMICICQLQIYYSLQVVHSSKFKFKCHFVRFLFSALNE